MSCLRGLGQAELGRERLCAARSDGGVAECNRVWSRLVWSSGQIVWFSATWSGLVWSGLGWSSLVWSVLAKPRLN